MTSDFAVYSQIETALDGPGSVTPTLLPWLARWATGPAVPDVAFGANGQVLLAAARRWPAVTDAVAEQLAARITEDRAIEPELFWTLPQLTAYLNGEPLETALERAPTPDAVGYAELTHPNLILPVLARPGELWPPILAAARKRPVPPLAHLGLLGRLVAGPPIQPADLSGGEAAYLLPFLPAEPPAEDAAEAAVAEAEDYADGETYWYTAAICARIAPYLNEDQRSRIDGLATTAPPTWRPLLGGLARRRDPWAAVTDELAAAQPALAQLDEVASAADPGALSGAFVLLARLIESEYSGGGQYIRKDVANKASQRILRPRDSGSQRDWLSLKAPAEAPPLLATTAPADNVAGSPTGGKPEPDRYLVGRYPAAVAIGETFGLLIQITTTAAIGSAKMQGFHVSASGTDVQVFAYPQPGLRLRSQQRVVLHVPPAGQSEPALFELQANAPGPRQVDVIVFLGGKPVGELKVEITTDRDARPGSPSRTVSTQIDSEPSEGAVALSVRYDPTVNSYRFQFIDDNYDDEVPHQLSYEPGPQVERLIAKLDDFARGRTTYSPADALEALSSTGKTLWQQLLPEPLREQFWERQSRIERLTILSKQDTMPWELMYPRDPGRDKGFLVQQFPVTRWIFGRGPARSLPLGPARFVLPSGSLSEAEAEIDAIRAILAPGQSPDEVLTSWRPVRDLANSANFGVLHFACHNSFDPGEGSSIRFDDGLFRPEDLADARADKTLLPSAPVVFVNACRTAGAVARYNQLDGWAQAFFDAGTAVFIGSLWAVETERAKDFAIKLYRDLKDKGRPLGEVVTEARAAAARGDGDPTWLAYTVYGDADARKAI